MNIYTRLNPEAIPFEDIILEKRQSTFVIVKWNADKLGDQPTDQELLSLFNEFNSHYSEYAVNRRKEYPPVAEYLDGIVKGDQAQIQAYIDSCLAVKEKYAKP